MWLLCGDDYVADATEADVTIAVCLLAAVIETVLGCTSTAGLSPGDAIIVLFVIGPYLLLALFAWRKRGQPATSWVLLVVAVGMSVWGLYVFGEDSYRYHTDQRYRMVQRMAVFFVPLVQWAIVLVVGLVLLVSWLGSPRGRPASCTEPAAATDRPREGG